MGGAQSYLNDSKIKQTITHSGFHGVALEMNGKRSNMEDEHIIALNYKPNHSLLAVMDGHAGDATAKYIQSNLVSRLQQIDLQETKAIQDCFCDLDAELQARYNETLQLRSSDSGTTAIVVDIEHRADTSSMLTIMNLGDSRCIVIDGRTGSVKFHTKDHKPLDPEERKRISAAGSWVSPNNRVVGELAVSRAFGDFQYKIQGGREHSAVSPSPDVTRVVAEVGDYVLIACDGLFERTELNWVVSFLYTRLTREENPLSLETSLLELFSHMGNVSNDNISSILIKIDPTDFESKVEDLVSSPQFLPMVIDEDCRKLEDSRFCDGYKSFIGRLPDSEQVLHFTKEFQAAIEKQNVIVETRKRKAMKVEEDTITEPDSPDHCFNILPNNHTVSKIDDEETTVTAETSSDSPKRTKY
jgi:serine/threonine protein phosphatase PrpC